MHQTRFVKTNCAKRTSNWRVSRNCRRLCPWQCGPLVRSVATYIASDCVEQCCWRFLALRRSNNNTSSLPDLMFRPPTPRILSFLLWDEVTTGAQDSTSAANPQHEQQQQRRVSLLAMRPSAAFTPAGNAFSPEEIAGRETVAVQFQLGATSTRAGVGSGSTEAQAKGHGASGSGVGVGQSGPKGGAGTSSNSFQAGTHRVSYDYSSPS